MSTAAFSVNNTDGARYAIGFGIDYTASLPEPGDKKAIGHDCAATGVIASMQSTKNNLEVSISNSSGVVLAPATSLDSSI